jgi:hypothetical protein
MEFNATVVDIFLFFNVSYTQAGGEKENKIKKQRAEELN